MSKSTTTIDDGGPAFPTPTVADAQGVAVEFGAPGMSLRDYFAGQALAGCIANDKIMGTICAFAGASSGRTMKHACENQEIFENISADVKRITGEFAYCYADAMLLARSKGGAE